MVPTCTAVKHIYQTPHNQQTVSKGVREKRCLLPWDTSTKQSANSQQGTVGKQSAGTVSRNSQQTSLQMRLSSNSVHATIMSNKQLTGYTAATNATICHYHRRHSFPPPPLCAVAADTAAATDRARHCRHSLLLLVLLNRRTCCCCHRRRERACVCVHVCERECVNVCVSPDNRQGL